MSASAPRRVEAGPHALARVSPPFTTPPAGRAAAHVARSSRRARDDTIRHPSTATRNGARARTTTGFRQRRRTFEVEPPNRREAPAATSTRPSIADGIYRRRAGCTLGPAEAAMRVGIGYDVHPFDPARLLVLGGVKIEGTWGLKGTPTRDVVLHAVADALLGAAALGDLGDHFPDRDPAWKDVALGGDPRRGGRKVRARGYVPGNVDVTVVAERPRIAPYRAAMRERMAEILGLPVGRSASRPPPTRAWGRWGAARGSRPSPSPRSGRGGRGVRLAGRGLALAAASSSPLRGRRERRDAETVREVAENVLTLQTRDGERPQDRRGTGPFRGVRPPARMPACSPRRCAAPGRGAAGGGALPVEVYVSRRYGEVLAKEGFERPGQGYADPFRSAALAIVHPVPGRPDGVPDRDPRDRPRPVHRGTVHWERPALGLDRRGTRGGRGRPDAPGKCGIAAV